MLASITVLRAVVGLYLPFGYSHSIALTGSSEVKYSNFGSPTLHVSSSIPKVNETKFIQLYILLQTNLLTIYNI